MANYGETIAYWYLRLNGFFPLLRFVLHRHELTISHSADCDLLALRHPYVYEVIGGQEIDWDTKRFENWGIDLAGDLIGIIVEVKTGRRNGDYEERIVNAFSPERIEYALQRLGFWHREGSGEIVEYLTKAPLYRDDEKRLVVAKLLIAAVPPRINRVPPMLHMSLDEADDFVTSRMRKYAAQKNSDRHFFPSDLIQYVIWKNTQGG